MNITRQWRSSSSSAEGSNASSDSSGAGSADGDGTAAGANTNETATGPDYIAAAGGEENADIEEVPPRCADLCRQRGAAERRRRRGVCESSFRWCRRTPITWPPQVSLLWYHPHTLTGCGLEAIRDCLSCRLCWSGSPLAHRMCFPQATALAFCMLGVLDLATCQTSFTAYARDIPLTSQNATRHCLCSGTAAVACA